MTVEHEEDLDFNQVQPILISKREEKALKFLLELHLIYDDGTIEVINTDKTWKCHKSHILIDNIYDGEYQDMNLYIENWIIFECDENDWKNCNEIKGKHHEKLVPRFSVPVVIKERLKPQKILKTEKGETIIDIGQNMTGWIEIKNKASKDFKVIIEHGEILFEGNFYNENNRSALEQFCYISNGNETVVHPHFTYFGFRYARLTNWEGQV